MFVEKLLIFIVFPHPVLVEPVPMFSIILIIRNNSLI